MTWGVLILRPDGTRETRTLGLHEMPPAIPLRDVVRELLGIGAAWPEHVAVLHEGRRADMFVHEDGHGERLPRNEAATAIYRAWHLSQNPGEDPEASPWIAGPAVIFDRIVWS